MNIVPIPVAYTVRDTDQQFLDSFPKIARDGFIQLGEVSLYMLNMQCQYAVRYLDERQESFLGEGLTFKVNLNNYHDSYIKAEDVLEFVARVRQYRWDTYQVAEGQL
jgi:hypothetical protein